MADLTKNLGTLGLVLAALGVSAAAVHHEFFAPPRQRVAGMIQRRHIDDAESFATGGNVIGATTAPIRIVEFSDFQCPYCQKLSLTLDSLVQRNPDVAIVYRHFPIEGHSHARMAANAAECAATAGKFSSYVQTLFSHQDSLGTISWARLAQLAGVMDTVTFEQCRTLDAGKPSIDRDIRDANRIAISGTPTLIIGSDLVAGALPLDSLEKMVADIRAKKRSN